MSVFNYEGLLNAINLNNTTQLLNEQQRRILGGIDSIHDFYDEGGRVPINAWDSVYTALKQNLNKITNTNINNASQWLIETSNRGITSISKVEDQAVSYFENVFESQLKVTYTKILTYRQIINEINKISKDYREKNNNAEPNINDVITKTCTNLFGGDDYSIYNIDIDMASGEDWDMNYTRQDKIYIALFLLNFFFPPPPGEPNDYNTRFPSYITFDADSNIPSKIFGLLDQVINLVTPLNIADSAVGGETHLAADKTQKRAGIKNKYEFPVQNTRTPGTFLYTSNIYGQIIPKGYRIELSKNNSNQEYDEKTKYDFKIDITGSLKGTILFDKNNKSGPSVMYLSNLIGDLNNAFPRPNMVDISILKPIQLNQRACLLFDIKRSGDWEQCDAAYTINKNSPILQNRTILCSIDRLCALYSRCLGQNTILHYGTHLKLYRFPGNVSEDQKRKMAEANDKANQERAEKYYESVTKLCFSLENKAYEIINSFSTLKIKGLEKNAALASIGNELLIKSAAVAYNLTQKMNSSKNQVGKILKNPSQENANPIFINFLQSADLFFKDLSSLSGQTVNSYNYQQFIDNYINRFTILVPDDGVPIINKGRFIYFDSELLTNLSNAFVPILLFDEKKTPRSITIKNYKEDFEKECLPILNKINGNLTTATEGNAPNQKQVLFDDFVQSLKDAKYDGGNTIELKNKEYYKEINYYISQFMSNIEQTGGAGALSISNMPKDGLTFEPASPSFDQLVTAEDENERSIARASSTAANQLAIQNILQTTANPDIVLSNLAASLATDLTNEFILFSVSIFELFETTYDGLDSELNFITLFKDLDVTDDDIEVDEDIDYERGDNDNDNKNFELELLINNFLENSFHFIKNAEENFNQLNTGRVFIDIPQFNAMIKNYLQIYLVLACLNVNNIFTETTFGFFQNVKRGLVDNFQMNTEIRGYYINLINALYAYYYNEYLPTNYDKIQIGMDDNFCYILNHLYKILIINADSFDSLKYNNFQGILFFIITVFRDLFKFVIFSKRIATPDVEKLSTMFGSLPKALSFYGYYPGMIEEFNSTNVEVLLKNIGLEVNKLIDISTRETFPFWEYVQNVNIYSKFQNIMFGLVTYMNTLHNSEFSGGGNKIRAVKRIKSIKPETKSLQKTKQSTGRVTKKQKQTYRIRIKSHKYSKRRQQRNT